MLEQEGDALLGHARIRLLLRGGFTPADTAKIVGGNYVRLFAAAGG